jgi:hypothetical protein
MKKIIMAFILLCLLVVGVFFYTEWIKENEKQRVANRFIENAEIMQLVGSISFDFESEINIRGLEIFMPTEILQNSKYKSELPITKGTKEGIILLKDSSIRRVWISNYGDFFIVEGIEGYFSFDAIKLEEWKKNK